MATPVPVVRAADAMPSAVAGDPASAAGIMSAPSAVALTLSKIHKRFGTFGALRSVDLEIRSGELVCFLGPSGCGKTTLLRIIAGLERQTSGTVVQDGRDVSNAPPAARDYGIVFQS